MPKDLKSTDRLIVSYKIIQNFLIFDLLQKPLLLKQLILKQQQKKQEELFFSSEEGFFHSHRGKNYSTDFFHKLLKPSQN